jgi:hypothetical protein
MKNCNCEHWQVCPTCMPSMFDEDGKIIRRPPPPSKEDLESAGHRLALELECLLMDTKDLPTVSKWWDSAHEALDGWRALHEYQGPRLGDS